MRIARMLGVMILALAVTLLLVPAAQAQDPTPTAVPEEGGEPTPVPEDAIRMTVTLADLGLGGLALNGLYNANSVWIPLPTNWIVDGEVQVDLGYVASPLLSKERASLTILVNGEVLTSFRPFNDGYEHRLSFTIPPAFLYSSGFSLDFDGYLRMTTEACEEWDNPGQWLNILDSTSVTLIAHESVVAPDLSTMVRDLIIQNTMTTPPALVFVLPDDPDSATLSVAGQVAARLAQQNKGLTLPIETATTSTITNDQLAADNLVIFGVPDGQPLITEMADALPAAVGDGGYVTQDGFVAPAAHGVIQIFNSPWNETRRVLLVSGGSEDGLVMAGQAFARLGAFEELVGSFQFVESVDVLAAAPTSGPWLNEQKTTFTQLGYDTDRVLPGVGTASTSYAFREPPGWTLEPGAQVTLNLAYSPALQEGSHVSVFIDDILVGTAHTGDQSGQTDFTFDLPVDELNQTTEGQRPQTMRMRLAVSNVILSPACEFVDPESAWVRVRPDSFFVTPHTYMPLPDLQAFPYPFVNDHVNDPVAIVLPLQPEAADIGTALSLAATLGNFTLRDFNLSLVPADEAVEADYADAHLIVLGDTTRQPLIDELQAMMPTIPDIGLYQALENSNNGVLREDVSPWNVERSALLVYGQTPEGFQRAVQALYNAAPPVDESGLIALIEGDGMAPRVVYRIVPQVDEAAPIDEATPEADATETPAE